MTAPLFTSPWFRPLNDSGAIMPEEWMPVVGFENLYEVSSFGRVKSLIRIRNGRSCGGKTLKPVRFSTGYDYVTLCRLDGYKRIAGVHVLVLEAFVGLPPKKHIGCHENGIPWDNRLLNLRWKTQRENNLDKNKHGTMLRGERHGNAKYCATDIERVKDLRSCGCTQTEISDWTGICQAQVSDILNRKSWSHA